METEKLNLYDSVDTYAMRVLAYNAKFKGSLTIENLKKENRDLWFLNLLNNLDKVVSFNCYFKENFFDYLYFKYIKKFKFLKLYNKKIDSTTINADNFIVEMIKAFNISETDISLIYELNYRR